MGAGFAALLATPLLNGIVVAQLLVLTRSMNTARQFDVAATYALLTVLVLTASDAFSAALHSVLPLAAEYSRLRLVVVVVIIGTLAQLSQIVVQRTWPLLAMHMPQLARRLALNCVVLTVLLKNAALGPTVVAAALHGLGAGLGFALLLVLAAGLRERSVQAVVPAALRGTPIALVTLTILTLALAGLVGARLHA